MTESYSSTILKAGFLSLSVLCIFVSGCAYQQTYELSDRVSPPFWRTDQRATVLMANPLGYWRQATP